MLLTEPRSSSPIRSQWAAELREELTRVICAICPPWLSADREDLVQTTVLAVSRHLDDGEGVDLPSSSYLRRVAHNALVDEIRRRRRRREVPLQTTAMADLAADRAPGPEAVHRGGEIRRGIRECLQRLVRSRRMAVTLYLLGHSVPRASELLGWGRKRTENLVFRGLSDLRSCLESMDLRP